MVFVNKHILTFCLTLLLCFIVLIERPVFSADLQTVTYQFDLMIIPDGLLCRNSNVEFRRT